MTLFFVFIPVKQWKMATDIEGVFFVFCIVFDSSSVHFCAETKKHTDH